MIIDPANRQLELFRAKRRVEFLRDCAKAFVGRFGHFGSFSVTDKKGYPVDSREVKAAALVYDWEALFEEIEKRRREPSPEPSPDDPITSITVTEDQRAELMRSIDAWATRTPSEPYQNFTWTPPVPVVLTGIRVSCPVVMTRVTLANRLIAAPALEVPLGSYALALPRVVSERIGFRPCLFSPGEQLLVELKRDSSVTMTLEWQLDAYLDYSKFMKPSS